MLNRFKKMNWKAGLRAGFFVSGILAGMGNYCPSVLGNKRRGSARQLQKAIQAAGLNCWHRIVSNT